jgi:hypothetical protein
MTKKLRETIITKLIGLAFTVLASFVTSLFTMKYKLDDIAREKLNENFSNLVTHVNNTNYSLGNQQALLMTIIDANKDLKQKEGVKDILARMRLNPLPVPVAVRPMSEPSH